MLELPEVLNISKQLEDNIIGKKVNKVLPPSKKHKFCWYNGEPTEYNTILSNSKITSVEGFGIFVEICFDNGYKLYFNDGVNIRLITDEKIPKDYQLLIELSDGLKLVFKVVMYGGIYLHDDDFNDEYYLKSKEAISPFSSEFKEYYYKKLEEAKPNLTAKAFLATKQRFPGIGNGVLQDILFEAGINPKTKISLLNEEETEKLFKSIIDVLNKMVEKSGRDTERDILGNKGGYKVIMCKNIINSSCPKCGEKVIKQTYLGGSVYYCPHCQPLVK